MRRQVFWVVGFTLLEQFPIDFTTSQLCSMGKPSREYVAAWRKKHPDKYRAGVDKVVAALRLKRGTTEEECKKMLAAQDYRCALCGTHQDELTCSCLDHDHNTNKVRGFLCRGCNLALGHFKDSVSGLGKSHCLSSVLFTPQGRHDEGIFTGGFLLHPSPAGS